MSAKRKNRVEHAGHTATIYRWTHPGTGKKAWRFAWRDGVSWRYTTCPILADAEIAALKQLKILASKTLDWHALPRERQEFLAAIHAAVTPADQETILATLASRRQSIDASAAVERFLDFKTAAKGHLSAHLEQMGRDLRAFALHFAGNTVADIQLATLADWWTLRAGTAGRDRKQGIRRSLVSFFIWAKREGMTGPDAVTVADRLPSLAATDKELYVFSPLEMAVLLHHVTPAFLPWLIFGAFAGMRPEEVAPKTLKPPKDPTKPVKNRVQKPGLEWDHLDWQFKVIRLPKTVSKVKTARIIPLHPIALEWLTHHGTDTTWHGRCVLDDAATVGETKRLGKILDQHFKRATGWPADALRHSYASYRNAVIRNLPQVAEEMGTSETMLHSHYHNPKTTEEGNAWFNLTPAKCAEMIGSTQSEKLDSVSSLSA